MTTIRATDPAQFLTLVPHLLGYTPTHSLVLVPFTGTRSAGAMCVDLPTVAEQHRQVGHVVAGLLCRIPDTNGLAAIIYDTHTNPTHAVIVGEIDRQSDACGLIVLDRLCVTGDGYGRVGETLHPPADLAPVIVDGKPQIDADQHSSSARLYPSRDYLPPPSKSTSPRR